MSNPASTFTIVSSVSPSGKSYWRVYFRDPATGKRLKPSTGIIDDGTKGSRIEAEKAALQIMEAAKYIPPPALAVITFSEFAARFWDWETSPYIGARLARDPKAISPEHAANQAANLKIHITPKLGPLPLVDITPDVLDDLVTDLLGRLSPATVKHIVNAMSPIFEQAIRKRIIRYNPTRSMMPFSARGKSRDAFTPAEASRLLDPVKVPELWADPTARKKCYRDGWRPWALSVLCAVTGARFGTVVALRREDITKETWNGQTYYQVKLERSLAEIRGIKEGSKTGRGTVVPVAPEVMEKILPHLPDEGQLFPSWGAHGVLTHHSAIRFLHAAMARAKIKDPEGRLLGYHAWRHTFVTASKAAGLSAEIRAAFTEHKDERTTDRYSHLKPFDLLGALPVQRSLVG